MSSLSHTSSSGADLTARLLRASVAPARRGHARARRSASTITSVLVACGLVTYVALSSPTTGDYLIGAPVAADNAGPAIAALSHGNFAGFVSQQPLMGLLSLLLRAPFVALTGALGGGQLVLYRVGTLICLLPAGLLAARLAVAPLRGTRTGSSITVSACGLVAAGALLISPPVLNAVRFGHPEEVLTATLAAVALLAAYDGRAILTGVLLGAAIGTKDWALIAVLPTFIALPAGRRRAALLAGGGVALALSAPLPLLDPAAFARASHALGATRLVNTLSAWWPLGTHTAGLPAAWPAVQTLPGFLTKAVALPVGVAVATGLALVGSVGRPGARLRARGRCVDAFALLCLLAVIRCVADTGPVEYYYVALVVPLAVWESAILRRLPLVTLLSVAAVWLTYVRGPALTPDLLNGLTLAWTGVLAGYLVFRAFRVGVDPRSELDMKAG
ncbi:MAG TPA: hypothetical protein VIJ20_05960 [Solirubrobacteraceae bacterium]